MQILSDLIPITNGEAFDIIRRNREQRNLKSLPHFFAQSVGAVTGSSAYQALALNSRFAQREAAAKQREGNSSKGASNSSGGVTLVPASVLTGGVGGAAQQAPHLLVAHTEVKVLHYLQKERDFYGPSSIVLGKFATNPDYNDSDNDDSDDDGPTATRNNTKAINNTNKPSSSSAAAGGVKEEDKKGGVGGTSISIKSRSAAAVKSIIAEARLISPKPLAAAMAEHSEKVEAELDELIAARGSAYDDEASPDDIAAFEKRRLELAQQGPKPPRLPNPDSAVPSLFFFESVAENVASLDHCLARLRENGQSCARALIAVLKTRCFTGEALVALLAAAWAEQSEKEKRMFLCYNNNNYTMDVSTIERGVAKRLSNAEVGLYAATTTTTTTTTTMSPTTTAINPFTAATTAQDRAVLSTKGLPISPAVLRNVCDLRHSLTEPAHVGCVVPAELDFIGDLAEYVLRYEIVRAAEEKNFLNNNKLGSAVVVKSEGGGNNDDDAFATPTAQYAYSSATTATAMQQRFQGVDDPAIAIPKDIIENFRLSAIIGLCSAIADVLKTA